MNEKQDNFEFEKEGFNAFIDLMAQLIEEEMKAEHEKEQQAASTATAPARSSRWDWGK